MWKSCLALFVVTAAAVCNKPCLDLCLPFQNEKYCFDACGCKGPTAIGREIVTEDGRHFQVAAIPPNTVFNDDGYHYMGCNVDCAEVCFRFASGYNLLNCVVGHCRCQALVQEVFLPQPAPVSPPAPVIAPPQTHPVAPPVVPQAQPVPQPYTPAPAPQAPAAPASQPYTPAPVPQAPVPATPQPAQQPPTPAPQPPAPTPQPPAPTPQPPAPTPQPPAPAPQPPTPQPPTPPAPQPVPPPTSTVSMPFRTQDGRQYEIRPLVSDSEFFQSGCAACVDACARITVYEAVIQCLGFCSCQTQVREVRPTFPY